MPYASDKIIINGNGLRGRFSALMMEFQTAETLGSEIVDNGWASETVVLRDEMKVECAKIDKAIDHYLEFMRKFNEKLADFIDNHSSTP